MNIYKKTKLKIKFVYNSIINNGFSFFLTISGIIIATIILSVGYILLDSYSSQNKLKYTLYKDNNSYLVKGDLDQEKYNKINSIVNNKSTNVFTKRSTEYLFSGKTEESNILFSVVIYESFANFHQKSMPTFYNTNIIYQPKLLKGRGINNEDIVEGRNVIIIDDILEKQLFGDNSGINKDVAIPVYKDVYLPDGSIVTEIVTYERFKIIGVISHSDQAYTELTKAISGESINYLSNVFIPVTYRGIVEEEQKNIKSMYYLTDNLNNNQYESIKDIIKKNQDDIFNNIDIHNYESIIKSIDQDVYQFYQLFDVISIVLLIIAGTSIFNTLLFTTKEKISEIGIKKAVGISNRSMMFEVILEGFLYGLIGVVIGFILSLFIVTIILSLLNYYLKLQLILYLSYKTVIFLFAMPILCTIIASIPISIYASNIKIVDALRFDW